MENHGATVVITHHVLEGKHQEYERWLTEIGSLCRQSTGHIDWQIIRPIPELSFTYTVIIRFDTIGNLKDWMESEDRAKLIKKANKLLAKDDHYHIIEGLDFLFMKSDEPAKVPVRWKQYLVTWSAIYPLSLLIPMVLLPVLRKLGSPQNRFFDSFFISGIIVFIMVYLLMPQYTRLIKKWLYK